MSYTLLNRKTNKMSRKFSTREAARTFKRESGFKYSIVQMPAGKVVR